MTFSFNIVPICTYTSMQSCFPLFEGMEHMTFSHLLYLPFSSSDSQCVPLITDGAKSGEYGGCSSTVIFVAKVCFTESAV